MTFSEKLDRAKIGSKTAYESICLTCIDSLYAAALIALKNESAARTAVIDAVNDGFSGIARIKDEKHLRSWLVHELTKNIVDMLKEFKAGGTVYEAAGDFAETGRLTDVERIVYSLAAVFDYGTREISVLTGMPENAVSDKLFSAKAHLGSHYEEISEAAGKCTAPESLRERYMTFDESLARLEASSVYPVTGLDGLAADSSGDKNTSGGEDIPAAVSETAEETDISEDIPEEVQPSQEAAAEETAKELHDERQDTQENNEDNVFMDEDSESEAVPDEESAVDDFPEDGREEDSPLPLNAETFIAVVSAEKMKGSEFLRLIGNTRISNSVYREIEQNPGLTKKRLIRLLEESPLTETDYYKLLTAVKHRREVLAAKEELQAVHERAGLFSGAPKDRPSRRRRREEPKTELQMAIEMDLPKKKSAPLTINEENRYEEWERRIPPAPERHHRSAAKKPNDDLGSFIADHKDNKAEEDREPFHPAEMSGIFNSIRELEAVDPIAVIYAEEDGAPAKPGRIPEQDKRDRNTDEIPDSEQGNVSADRTPEGSTSSPEPADISDTRPLDVPFPKLPASDKEQAPAAEERPSANSITYGTEQHHSDHVPTQLSMSAFEDEDPVIVTHKPENNLSLTQIIRDYSGAAPGDISMSVDEAIGGVGSFVGQQSEKNDNAAEPDKHNKPVRPEPEDDEPYDPFAEHRQEESVGSEPEDDEPFSPSKPGIKDDVAAKSVDESVTGFTAPLHIDVPIDGIGEFDDDDDEDDEDDDEVTEAGDEEQPEKDKPTVNFVNDEDEEPDDDTDNYGDTTEIKLPGTPAKPAGDTERVHDDKVPLPVSVPYDDEQDDEDAGEDEEKAPKRERYKGNEFFVDDDEYVEGINNGKMIFCAVCAVLLFAGAIVMKFVLPKPDAGTSVPDVGTPVQTDSADSGTSPVQASVPSVSVPVESKDILGKLSSYDDIAAAGTAVSHPAQTAQYLRASSEPYESFLSQKYLTTDSAAYIYNEGTIRTVSLDPAAPVDLGTVSLTARDNSEFLGFTVIEGTILAVTQGKNIVYAEMFGGSYTSSETYSVPGTFVEMGMLGGKPVIVTHAPVNGTEAPHSSAASAPAPEEIVKLNGAEYSSFTAVAEVGGDGMLDILGGCAAYAKFGKDKLTILAEDNNTTFAVDVTSDFKAENARRFVGAAFSADCLNGDSFIGSNEIKTDVSGTRQYSGVAAVKGDSAVGTGFEGERPYAVAWQDENTACVLASRSDGSTVLYGFDMSGSTPAAAQITDTAIYSDKLVSVGDALAGLRAKASADGERVGLQLSRYTYSGKLNETSKADIGLDANSPAENLKYLRSPAEDDPSFIAASEDGSIIAVPTVYFDGFSEVERIVTFSNGTALTPTGEILLYDEKSLYLCAAIRQGTLFIITDSKVMTANASDCSDMKTIQSVSAALAE